MLITDGGKVLRCPVGGISSMGRATQGVRVMKLAPDEKLVAVARLAEGDLVAPVAPEEGTAAPEVAAPARPNSTGLEHLPYKPWRPRGITCRTAV